MHIKGLSCLALDNKKWKISRDKCVDCSPCPLGKARNLSEPYAGPSVPEGDIRCLPCRECPPGFYAGDFTCRPCRIFCEVDYKREFDEICEGSHDARCGSCLFGYENIYRNSKYPCSLEQVAVGNNNGYPGTIQNGHGNNVLHVVGDTLHNTSKYFAGLEGNEMSQDKPVVKDETPFPVMQVTATICALLVLVIFVIYLLQCFLKKRRNQTTGNIKSSDEVFELQTLETDGEGSQHSSVETEPISEIRHSDVGDSEYSSQMVAGHVARLGRTVPLSFELPHVGRCINTYTKRAFCFPYEAASLTEQLPCGCHNNTECRCYISDLPNTEIQKNDKFLLTVSTSMCHSPEELFDALKLDHAVRYPVQNDREIDPVRTTFQDKNLRLLNRWVEIQSTSANLNSLMKALCKSRFHKINQKLKDKYSANTSLLENDNGMLR